MPEAHGSTHDVDLYPQVFGKYVLERELSRGGMARVVLATLRGAGGFEKKLVVKQIRDELAYDQQFVRRFVEEAKTTVALSHPNIVPVYELGVEQGTYFLAMELVEGVSIAELLREWNADGSRRVLSPEEGAYVGVEVCRALDYAHRRMKVVHRDITPRNVMIDEEGQIKLIDFGIAAPALVAGHEILGSPGHMAPEQVDGGELGPPTDIFAVAVLLMEAWTGSAPFRRATPEECAAAVREPHPKPSDHDPRLLPLDEAIRRAMRVDPRERQQEASDLARALRSFLQGVDLADLARGLGDRVRDLRRGTSPSSPPSETTASRRTSHDGDLGTKTFAAREEALSWSSPPDGASDAPAASTRQLPQSKPHLVAARDAQGRPDDPGIPTPRMVEVADAAEPPPAPSAGPPAGPRQADIPTVRRRSRPRSSDAPAAVLETIATRPLEAPVHGRSRGANGLERRRPALVVAAFALLAASGLAAWRLGRDRPGDGALPSATVTTTTTVASAAATSSPVTTSTPSAVAPEPRTSASSPNAALASAKVGASAPVPAVVTPTAPVSATVAGGRASVTLLGDPGTRVSIDGTSRGSCPVRVALEQGPHEVRFTFEPTGESRGERFSIKSGEHVTVRAEFTGATPTVRIQR